VTRKLAVRTSGVLIHQFSEYCTFIDALSSTIDPHIAVRPYTENEVVAHVAIEI
jgi:flagellar biosynthesis chaperone FliJ